MKILVFARTMSWAWTAQRSGTPQPESRAVMPQERASTKMVDKGDNGLTQDIEITESHYDFNLQVISITINWIFERLHTILKSKG